MLSEDRSRVPGAGQEETEEAQVGHSHRSAPKLRNLARVHTWPGSPSQAHILDP